MLLCVLAKQQAVSAYAHNYWEWSKNHLAKPMDRMVSSFRMSKQYKFKRICIPSGRVLVVFNVPMKYNSARNAKRPLRITLETYSVSFGGDCFRVAELFNTSIQALRVEHQRDDSANAKATRCENIPYCSRSTPVGIWIFCEMSCKYLWEVGCVALK